MGGNISALVTGGPDRPPERQFGRFATSLLSPPVEETRFASVSGGANGDLLGCSIFASDTSPKERKPA